MMLTETIEKCTSALSRKQAVFEKKQSDEAFSKAIAKLSSAEASINDSIDCIASMRSHCLLEAPVIDSLLRDELVELLNNCGNGISDGTLSAETVNLLKAKGETLSQLVANTWKSAAVAYSEGTKGYLSIISGFSDNPKYVNGLIVSIEKSITASPSTKEIDKLVNNVAEAKKETDKFQLSPEIEQFLEKVAKQQATVFDLTPEVLAWLGDKKLTNKLKVRF